MFSFLLLLSCTDGESNTQKVTESIPQKTSKLQQENPKVIFLGDSLSAGMGLAKEQAFPHLLDAMLDEQQLPTSIINAGVSGDTTSGGLRRLNWILKQDPQLIVLELGANDGLRGQPLTEIEKNLSTMIETIQQQNIAVILVGMQVPTNYGNEYTQGFADIYPKLAKKYKLPFVPFLLEGVAGEAHLNQPDGIHPTAEGQKILAQNVLPILQEWRAKQE